MEIILSILFFALISLYIYVIKTINIPYNLPLQQQYEEFQQFNRPLSLRLYRDNRTIEQNLDIDETLTYNFKIFQWQYNFHSYGEYKAYICLPERLLYFRQISNTRLETVDIHFRNLIDYWRYRYWLKKHCLTINTNNDNLTQRLRAIIVPDEPKPTPKKLPLFNFEAFDYEADLLSKTDN